MTDVEMLQKVKLGLFGNVQGEWRDETLKIYINEVKGFMRDAGVPDEVISSEASVGCVLMGVNDLWNYSSGGVEFSKYFLQRVAQLSAGGAASEKNG